MQNGISSQHLMGRMHLTALVAVKREASNASLRATTFGHILTPLQPFEWCSMHLTGLGFFYISKEEIEQSSLYLTTKFKKTHKIPGIRSFHCFIPNSNKELQVNRGQIFRSNLGQLLFTWRIKPHSRC